MLMSASKLKQVHILTLIFRFIKTASIFSFYNSIKDTSREKVSSNKTLTNVSTNTGHLCSWYIKSKVLKQHFQYLSDRSILYFWQGSSEWKCCKISVHSTKKRYSSFLKKVFFFQKICFKVLKQFKISSDCHIKTCRSFKRSAS